MNFEEYLISKKINPEAFEKDDVEKFSAWQKAFNVVHPSAFTARHMFTINAVRRKYKLSEETKKQEQPRPNTRPVIKPKLSN